MLHLAENSMKIGWFIKETQAVEGFAKQKRIPFNWVYHKINICEFRLILLDHITNAQETAIIHT